jgi:GntR family transcriptional regulator
LSDEEQVVRLERLRTADDQPIAYELDYLPHPRAANVYQRAKEIGDGSLYNLMIAEGLQPYLAEQVCSVGLASAREAELLRIAENAMGLRITSTAFDETGAPIEYTESFFPADLYDFRSTLRVAK